MLKRKTGRGGKGAVVETFESRNLSELLFVPTYRFPFREKSWQRDLLRFRSRSTAHLPIPPRVHISRVVAHTALQRKSQIFVKNRFIKKQMIRGRFFSCPCVLRSCSNKHSLLKLELMRSCADKISSENPQVLESNHKHKLLITLH